MTAPLDLTHVALVLFLAFLGGLFLQRFRQPALVGYILVGAVIGPGLLGLQGDDTTVRWLAELAVVLLMFMVGLELDLTRFRQSMRVALTVTALQIALSLGVMYGLSFIFHWDILQTMLYGFVVSLSSTAVAMTILRELGRDQSEAGQLATAILVAQDIAAIPMLLLITTFHGGTSGGDFVELGLALAAVGASIVGIVELTTHPAWVTRLERVFTAGTRQPAVAGLALCFGAAAFSGSIGLSTAYGAFAMGLLIGNVGELGASYRSAMHSLHDVLMMVFFLSIGLMLDARFVASHIVPIAFILGATVVLKTVGNALILRMMGTPPQSAYPLGAVLGQIGEFSFVLIALGYSNGFVGKETYQLALAVIALSLVISPVWLSLVRRYVRRSR
jgi:CPA2 family monovalent cation:H+ antiporter-2